MQESWAHQLETWHEFYLLLGTAGLTLTGLLFVVISLGPRIAADRHASSVRAFVSPNAVFFTSTLAVSSLFLVPGVSPTMVGVLLCFGAQGMTPDPLLGPAPLGATSAPSWLAG